MVEWREKCRRKIHEVEQEDHRHTRTPLYRAARRVGRNLPFSLLYYTHVLPVDIAACPQSARRHALTSQS